MKVKVNIRRLLLLSLAPQFLFVQSANGNPGDSGDDLANMSLQQLMDVQVTSVSRRPQKLLHSPSAIQVIVSDDIQRSGSTSIPEALRLASNLNVAQKNSHEWVISARGFSSDVGNKLLVLMDGRSVYTPLFSGVFWDRQDYIMADIDRVEVISGPGGTVWGANAVNGVINIITKSSADTQGWYSKAAMGDSLEGLANIRYGGAVGSDTHYRVYAKTSKRDNGYLSDGSEGADAWHMGQVGFRVDNSSSAKDNYTLQGDAYRSSSMLSFGKESDTSGGNLRANWSHTSSDNSGFSIQAYLDKTKLVLPVDQTVINGLVLAPEGVFKNTLDTMSLEYHQHYDTSDRRHKLVWGLEARKTDDNSENAPGLGFLPEELKQNLYSAFAEDELQFFDNSLGLTLGTKYEHTDYSGGEWEPNIRLRWNLDSDKLIWAAASHAVRTPSRIDRDISQPAPPNLVILKGGKNFVSEKLDAYELGYRSLLSQRVFASMSLFYNKYNDIRSTGFTETTILPFFFENNLQGNTQGFEINLNINAREWWRMDLGYNYLHEDLRVKPGAFDFNNAHNETADPQNQFNLGSSIDIGENMDLDLRARWVDRLPTNNAGVLVYVPSYSELDARFAWRLNPALVVSIVGKNLLHEHHQEFGVPSDSQEEVGRNLFVAFRWTE